MSATTEPPIRLDDSPEGNPRWRVLLGAHPALTVTRLSPGWAAIYQDGTEADHSVASLAYYAVSRSLAPEITI